MTTESISDKRFNAWQIKLFMVFLMVLNHLEYIYQFIQGDLKDIFVVISRCVAPVFAYLAIEGVLHTRNLKNYCTRLGIWTFIVAIGNILVEFVLKNLASGIPLESHVFLKIRTNITPTLLTGVLCVALILWGKARAHKIRILYYGASFLCFVIGFMSEWGVVLLPFMIVTYFFRHKKQERYIGYIIIEIVAILFRSEILYFLAFPFIGLYSGERGPNGNFNKYFFYVFYPLHLWFIAGMNFFLLTR